MARCVIGGLFVVALLILAGVWASSGVRLVRGMRGRGEGDLAAGVLAVAARRLPADRAAWGQAMLVELHHAEGSRARWQFSLGCVRAAAAIRIRAAVSGRNRGAGGMRAILLGSVATALGLGIYGVVRYPDLFAQGGGWPAAVIVLVMLIAYAGCAATLLRGTTPQAARARRLGVVTGVATGVAWIVVLCPGGLKAWVLVALADRAGGPERCRDLHRTRRQ